ncbi:MAG TPA: hypothetical protein VHQ65_03660 [Thermoanaerobaculia bacterium]|nr:hypothetical protein [Thermoanaerobaculia bacterium]
MKHRRKATAASGGLLLALPAGLPATAEIGCAGWGLRGGVVLPTRGFAPASLLGGSSF